MMSLLLLAVLGILVHFDLIHAPHSNLWRMLFFAVLGILVASRMVALVTVYNVNGGIPWLA